MNYRSPIFKGDYSFIETIVHQLVSDVHYIHSTDNMNFILRRKFLSTSEFMKKSPKFVFIYKE